MNALRTLLFGGRRPRSAETPRIDRAPPGAIWRDIRPRPSDTPVRAELARSNGVMETPRGDLRYQAGQHYIVHYAPDDRAPVRRAIFEQTYVRRDDGLYRKRTDLRLRYFTLPYTVIVDTLEGPEWAQAGDWIVEGAAGELWPVSAQDGEQKYVAT